MLPPLVPWKVAAIGSLAVVLCSGAFAQSNIVTLESKSGRTSASGTFLEIREGSYLIETVAGVLRFAVDDVDCVGEACPELSAAPADAAARAVTLTSSDGSVNIAGTLLGVEADQYVVDVTGLGTLRFDLSRVQCNGAGCPVDNIETTTASVTVAPKVEPTPEPEVAASPNIAPVHISGDRDIALGLLPMLLGEFAKATNSVAEFNATSETEYTMRPGGNTDEAINVSATDNAQAAKDLIAGTADLALTTRPIDGIAPTAILARDSFVIVTHPDNPIDAIRLEALADIYTGSITDWADLGGQAGAITAISFAPELDPFTTFAGLVFEDDGSGGADSIAPTVRLVTNGADMVSAIRNDPSAIGYVRVGRSEKLNPLALVDSCGQSHSVNGFVVNAGDAPLGQSIYLTTGRAPATANETAFLTFATSEAANKAFANSLFTARDISVEPQSAARTKALFTTLAEGVAPDLTLMMLSQIPRWDRASFTARFDQSAPVGPDNGAAEIERLLQYLEELPTDQEIALVGFSNDSESLDTNREASARAAESFQEHLLKVGNERIAHLKLSTQSYANLAPILCTTLPASKVINSRVEIWLRNDTP